MEKPKSYWATNIRFLRNRKKFSQEELAETLAASRAKLASHENGTVVNPPVEDLLKFSTYFKISVDTLLRIDLSKLSELKIRELEAGNDSYAQGTKIRVLATTVDSSNNDNAEFIPVKAKAGYSAGYGDPDFIAKLPHFSLPLLPRNRKHRMFPTEGDSMNPIPEGSFVAGEYVEDWKDLKARTACIVVTKDEGIVFKPVTPDTGKKVLLLESINSLYTPYEVTVGDVLEIWKFACYVSDKVPDGEATLENIAADIRELRQDMAWMMGRRRIKQ